MHLYHFIGVSLLAICSCEQYSLSQLLPSTLRDEWCAVVPEIHFFGDTSDVKDEYMETFRRNIRSLTGSSRNTLEVKTIAGGTLKQSYLYCNGHDKFLCHAWDDEKHVEAGGYWHEPSQALRDMECNETVTTDEDVMFFTNFYSDNYGHFLHDNFPGMMMGYALRERLAQSPTAKIMVPSNAISDHWLNLAMKDRMKDVITYHKKNKICLIHESKTNANQLPGLHIMHLEDPRNIFNIRNPFISSIATASMKTIVDNPTASNLLSTSNTNSKCNERYVIFYLRAASANTFHGRPVMNNDDVIKMIQTVMTKHGRTEKLIIFNGQNHTFSTQYELFSCARMIIGPHGSGLGNIMWAPHSANCADPVHVIEITCGSRCPEVHSNCPYNRNYFGLTGGFPWGVYHMMALTPESTNKATWISVNALEALIDGIFSGRKFTDGSTIEANGQTFHSLIEKGQYPV